VGASAADDASRAASERSADYIITGANYTYDYAYYDGTYDYAYYDGTYDSAYYDGSDYAYYYRYCDYSHYRWPSDYRYGCPRAGDRGHSAAHRGHHCSAAAA